MRKKYVFLTCRVMNLPMLVLLFFVLGLGALILGSHWLINSLKSFSHQFGLKPLFLSIVVLGFVSSSPEWFVTVTAGMRGLSSAALGNILGSNVINILLVLSLTGLFYKFSSGRQVIRFDMPVLIAGVLILGLFALNRRLDCWEAMFLILFFSSYLFLSFKKGKDSSLQNLSSSQKSSLFKAIRDLVLGFVLLFAGSSLLVGNSLSIVKALSLSERFAGVFILSLSTSLPELAASLQAAFKKEGEMAVGNIVGSNIFNTLFVLGSAGVLNPLYFSEGLFYDYFFMLAVTLALWVSLLLFSKIPKLVCAFFVLSYFIYIVFVSEVYL